MFNTQQSDFLMHEPAVFGKPWFWERNSGSMESSRSLAHVIMEMRDEIKKLEAENKVLRGEISQPSSGSEPLEGSLALQAGVRDFPPHINLRRNVSAPALEGQFKENIVMTVRRYSIASHIHTLRSREGVEAREGLEAREGGGAQRGAPAPTWGRQQQEVNRNSTIMSRSQSQDEGVTPAEEKFTNRHSLQEYVNKSRAKVKTVTFLLPVEDIYTSRPVLATPLQDKESADQDTVTETSS